MNNITVLMPENGEQTFTQKQLVKFEVTDTGIAEMKEQYMPLKIAGIDDKNGFNIVHNARMIVKGKRILVEKKRKELNIDAKAYINSVNSEAERITNLLSPIENYLESEETRIEQERETLKREAIERENKRIQDRINQITAYGYAVDYSEIKSMTDIAFNDLLEQARIEHEKDLAAKAEAEQLRKQEFERLKQERVELDAIRTQQQYEANILKAEEVRVKKEQEARERDIKAQQDKIDAEKLQRQKEADEKIRLGNLAADKILAKDKERQLAKEAEEKELALRPDREKIKGFITILNNLKYPDVNSKELKRVIITTANSISGIIDYLNNWLNNHSVLIAEYDPATSATIVEGGKVYEENDIVTTTK